MTTSADDRVVEEAFEAFLAGRPVQGEAAGLAAFTRAVRGTADRPGRPNAALAELLSTGLLTDQSSPSTRTAPAAGPLPSRRTRGRTRRRFTVIVPALIAKFLSAGAVAQAATGAGVVVVVVTGAGAAGVLPEDAQKTFSDVTGINKTVDEATDDLTEPVTEPVDDGELANPAELPEVEVAETEDDELTPQQAWAQAGPEDASQQAFKEWLAEGSENGWVNGQDVSYWAHKRNEAREAAREADETVADETVVDETEVEDADEQESEVESSGDDGDDSGKGRANGKGSGGKN